MGWSKGLYDGGLAADWRRSAGSESLKKRRVKAFEKAACGHFLHAEMAMSREIRHALQMGDDPLIICVGESTWGVVADFCQPCNFLLGEKSQSELGAHDPLCASPSAGLLPKPPDRGGCQCSFRPPFALLPAPRRMAFLVPALLIGATYQGSSHLGIPEHVREAPITTSAAGGEALIQWRRWKQTPVQAF